MAGTNMKQLVKRLLIPIARSYGRFIPSYHGRRFFCDWIVPYLMDPKVLPRGLVERPARKFGVNLLCDPFVFGHQHSYWCGVYYEEEIENYLLREVSCGDTVIDVGMNVGHVAIPAAKLVGSHGLVIAFEPNVELVQRVRLLADRQGLTQLDILPYGLGNVDGNFLLQLHPDHTGGATFRTRQVAENQKHTLECLVKVGDQVLAGRDFPGKVFLKMDVEGFEVQALEGLTNVLDKVNAALIEVSPVWLGADGVVSLFEIMSKHGMVAHRVCNDGSLGSRLEVSEVSGQMNVLFRRPA
jgi:FkbM family methyltransferase